MSRTDDLISALALGLIMAGTDEDEAIDKAKELFADHEAKVRADERAKIAAEVQRIRSELEATRDAGIDLGADYIQGLHSGLHQISRILDEEAGRDS